MNKIKKISAIILVMTMIFTIPFSTAYAVDEKVESFFHKGFFNVAEVIVEKLIDAISFVFPTPSSWTTVEKTNLPGFMEGTTEFLSEPAENAAFSLGYDSRSLIEGVDNIVGKMYVGGGIKITKKLATSIVDDLRVRTAAVSDGSSRGTSVLLELDAYGLALPDVREIRVRLADFIKENNINSITIAVLHQHSAVDTFGMNGDIFRMAFVNPFSVIFGKKTTNGKNDKYMENLYNQCTESVKAAVSSMKQGKLYYGKGNQLPYLYDKREPLVCDESFNRFRFVPDDGSRQTWLVSTEIHCVGNGAQGTDVTSDYPYYAEKYIHENADVNVLFFMGAQQSTSLNRDENTIPGYDGMQDRLEELAGFGASVGKEICDIKDETEVAPLLNIRFREIVLPISNPILKLAGKVGMMDSQVVKTEKGLGVLSELGYMELGNDLAFAIIPGELAPEIAYGGCFNADKSWSGKDWTYPSLQEIVSATGSKRTLKVLDLANDQVGYIVPDNNYMPMIAPESGSIEFVSLGSKTASTIVTEFETLVK